ncbi:MAG: hypothetical protein J6Z22_02185 [Lachnospiraceae bacterium]|nr:hypothetical protein [Lachnospiraceae bacterium]
MNCKNCNAVMREDHNRNVYVCPYCDSIEPMEGVSKAELQGMLRDAIVDVRKESIEQAKESLKKEMVFQDNRSAGQKILDALILILQIGFCLFLAIFTIGIFVNFEGVGFVSLIQLGLMITAMILKVKARKEKNLKLLKIKNACLIAVAVLVIVWFVALLNGGDSDDRDENKNWPKYGLASEIPEMEGTIDYSYSTDSNFTIRMKKVTVEEYQEYKQAVKDAGFVIDPEEDEYDYEAYNNDDKRVKLYYYKSDKSLSIDVYDAIPFISFKWPIGELAQEIPIPEADKMHIEHLDDTSLRIYVGDLTREEFTQYVFACQERGFTGSYEAGNTFDGDLGKLSVTVEFLRGRIMYIRLYKFK